MQVREWLWSKLCPELERGDDPVARQRCGMRAGAFGIALNGLLFGGKLAAGLASGALSVVADAVNNLSDAASSLVTLVGFRLAGRQADAGHPFGHGRMEYLAGLTVSVLILVVGVELARGAVDKIIHPQLTHMAPLSAAVLLLSVLVKLLMGGLYHGLARRLESGALLAAAADARADALATSAVLLGLGASQLTGVAVDGWVSLLVAGLVCRAGLLSVRDTLNPLLGPPPDPRMVDEIRRVILSHREVEGIHDLIIHDYGPGRRMMSVHAEVSDQAGLVEIHDVMDHIERELRRRFGLEAVLHADPVQRGNPRLERLRERVELLAGRIHPEVSVHDLRLLERRGRPLLCFDVVVPYEVKDSDEQIRLRLEGLLEAEDGSVRPVITVDRPHVS